jgi:hypothetical protein
MHGAPEQPAPATIGVVEFAAVVMHYHIDRVLIRRHYQRLAMGLGASALVIAYNMFHSHAQQGLQLRTQLAAWLVLAFLVFCLVMLTLSAMREQTSLRRPAATIRLRVMQVVDVVHRSGNLMLLLTAIGHGVLIIGTLIGLDLYSREGRVLIGALAPVILLCAHGLTQIPTCQRLCKIYGLTQSMEAAS